MPSSSQARKLRQMLIDLYDVSELRTLCVDLDIRYDDLPGDTITDKARELVSKLEREGRVPELIELGKESRPNASWDDLSMSMKQGIARQPLRAGQDTECDPEALYQCMAKDYGVGYNEIQVKCMIDSTGAAEVQRTVRVRAYSEIDELDTFLLSPEATTPSSRDCDFGVMAAISGTPGKRITVVRAKDKPGSHSGVVRIDPLLRYGDELTYELRETVPSKLYAIGYGEDELKKRDTPYDYFGWNITRPTRKLLVEVGFPRDFVPEGHDREVRFASASPGLPAERRQREQEKRLAKPHRFEHEPQRWALRLSVDYPMIGLIYMIRWQPTPIALDKQVSPTD